MPAQRGLDGLDERGIPTTHPTEAAFAKVAFGDRACAIENPDRPPDIEERIGGQFGGQQPFQLGRRCLDVLGPVVEGEAVAAARGHAPTWDALLLVEGDGERGPLVLQPAGRRQPGHASANDRQVSHTACP